MTQLLKNMKEIDQSHFTRFAMLNYGEFSKVVSYKYLYIKFV